MAEIVDELHKPPSTPEGDNGQGDFYTVEVSREELSLLNQIKQLKGVAKTLLWA